VYADLEEPALPNGRLIDALLAFEEAEESGTAPDQETWLARFPEVAPDLRDYFACRKCVEPLAEPLRSAAAAVREAFSAAGAPPPVALGNYDLLEEIGRGGMGIVYKAQQRQPRRLVAVKVLRAGALASAAEIERFHREADVIAHLDHPNIVPLYEVGETPAVHEEIQPNGPAGKPDRRGAPLTFFAMKLVDGGSLAAQLAFFRAVPAAAARLVAVLAQAVHYAHQRGILHRDLKPANVLVSKEWWNGEGSRTTSPLSSHHSPGVWITDFGLAKRLDDTAVTQSGVLVGTPCYMAPELTGGSRGLATTATDVYGLGAILYALLAGRPPFHAETVFETIAQVREREPVRPRSLNPAVDPDLETICLRCLAKDSGQRYDSAQALADDLGRYLRDEPIQARRMSSMERLRRWCRRQPLLAGLWAALGLSMFTGVGLVLWQWQRAESAAAQAAHHSQDADEQRAKAEANYRLARQAVDELLARASERTLRDTPGTQPARRELLQAALKYYETFLRDNASDPKLRLEMAVALAHVGGIQSEIGSKTEALQAYQRSRDLYRALLAERAGHAQLRADVARVDNRIGLLLVETGQAGAEVAYHRARTALTELCGQQPNDLELQFDLAAVLANLANWYRSQGAMPEARACLEENRDLMQRLVNKRPGEARFVAGLSGSLVNLGAFLLTADQPAKALESYQAARDLLEKATAAHPGDTDLQARLARIYLQIGSQLRTTAPIEASVTALERSRALFTALAQANPSRTDFQRDLAANHRETGHTLLKNGQRDEALEHYRQSRDLLQPLVERGVGEVEIRNDLAKAWFDMGTVQKPEEAMRSFQESVALRRQLLKDHSDRLDWRADLGLTLYNLGITRWNFGQRNEAIAAVREAVQQQRLASGRDTRDSRYRPRLIKSLTVLADFLRQEGHLEEAAAIAAEREKLEASQPEKPD
jgi:serine/threonine protein kinase